MSKRLKFRLLFTLICLGLALTVFVREAPEVRSADAAGGRLANTRLFYSSDAVNEVPFFLSKSVAIESGDNKNDFLVFIPTQSYAEDTVSFRDLPNLRHLENPRPDTGGALKIVFSAIGATGRKGIYLIDNYDPYSFGQLKAAPLWTDGNNNWHPSLNSRRNLLAFVSDAPGCPQIFLLDLKTRNTRQLTSLNQAVSPAIDALGEWIYFTGIDRENNYDIYKIRTNGRDLTRLTSSPEIEKYPTLTRYGRWIVYERGTKAERGIWLMSLEGKDQRCISDPRDWAAGPCMNATGSMVIFEGKIDGQRGIYLADVPEAAFRGSTAAEFSPGMDVQKEVSNLEQFGGFSREQLAKLSQYGFFVVPTAEPQLFYAYEQNEYNKIPSFVSADNLLQLLHIVFNTSLRKTEEGALLAKLTIMADRLDGELAKKKALEQDPIYLSLRRYFAVLYYLLHNKWAPGITAADRQVAEAELAKIKGQRETDSAVFKTKIDYSLFKVRGHYETSAKLRRYFLAMSWLGLMTFETKSAEDRRRIMLCAEIMSANAEVIKAFNDIYRITGFYVGESDDPSFYDFAAIWKRETGKPPLYSAFDDQAMQKVLAKLFTERQARIATYYEDQDMNKTKVIVLMGQRYVVDSHLFSLFFDKVSAKYLPGGLDLFATLENQTAYAILKDENHVLERFPAYANILPEGKRIMASLGEAKGDPLFNRWLRLLKIYANNQEKAAPAVFQSAHWRKKKLNTALASWAELKHDTILYGKQTGVECGGGDEPPKVYGYIEPSLELYQAMRNTLVSMDRELAARGGSIHGLPRILELIDFFILVSDKELRGIPLTDQENEQLRIIGGLLEANTIEALGEEGLRWFELTSESAKNMAVVADILSFWGRYLIEGVGYADDIYIIVPVQGQLYLMRGSVFSFYEFLHGQRLSDSEWYEMLKGMTVKERVPWWQPYLETRKEKIPAPADPYDSGC